MNFRELGNRLWSRPGFFSSSTKSAESLRSLDDPQLPKSYREWLEFTPPQDRRPFLSRLFGSLRLKIKPTVSMRKAKPEVKIGEISITGGTDF